MKLLLTLSVCAALMHGCIGFRDWRCSNHKDDSDYSQCMAARPILLRADLNFCRQAIKSGVFLDINDCARAVQNPAEYQCRKEKTVSQEAFDRCVWVFKNPIEAKCEEEAKKHGGYWDCIAIEKQEISRARDRELQTTIHEEQMEADRRARVGNAIQNAAKVYGNPAPARTKTTCRTKRKPFGGGLETVCD